MTDKYWVTYKVTPPTGSRISMRTGFLDKPEAADRIAGNFAGMDHVSNVAIEKISFVRQVKP